jgi:predicted aldo/keto reductase-like oxidoreductase
MQYKHLGRTGLLVSRLGLGTMNFGELTDEAASFEIMDKALEAGINFSIPRMSTAAPSPQTWRRATESPRRSSVAGSPRAVVAGG